MAKNFTSANQEIEDLLSKRDKILEKTAGFIAEAVLDRAKSKSISTGNRDATYKDINYAIKNFSTEEQVQILINTVLMVAANSGGNSQSYYNSSSSIGDMLNNRRR